jgi:hypothetical protein
VLFASGFCTFVRGLSPPEEKPAGGGQRARIGDSDDDRRADGKQTDLMVDDETQFVGPRGGVSKDGIKDDRLRVGAQLKVTMDGKTVKEIHLPYRNVRERLQNLGEKAKEEAKEIGGKAKEAAKKVGVRLKRLRRAAVIEVYGVIAYGALCDLCIKRRGIESR